MKGILRRLAGSRRARILTILGVAAFAAAFTFLGLWLSGALTQSAKSEAVPPPLTADDFWPDKQGVLHFCAVPGDVPDWPAGWCATELWFDPRNQRGRAESHDRDGTLESVTIVDGDYSAEYKRGDSIKIRRVLNGGDWYWRQWLMKDGQPVGFETWLTRGRFETTETTLDGVPTLRIQAPGLGEGGKQIATHTIYLDKESHLPIRMETEPASDAPDYVKRETKTFAYRVVEWLPAQDVDRSLFTLPEDLPQVPRTEREWEMTVQEARAFSGFDVYWVGEGFQGLTLSYLRDFSSLSRGEASRNFIFNYPPPGVPDGTALQVTSVPIQTFQATGELWDQPLFMPGAPGTEVTVAGTRGVLFLADIAQLRLRLGDTVIIINGQTKEQVLAAGDALAKLN